MPAYDAASLALNTTLLYRDRLSAFLGCHVHSDESQISVFALWRLNITIVPRELQTM